MKFLERQAAENKNDENRDEREKKRDERVRREKFGERLEQINKKSEGGIRSKKRFEFTRKRSRENIQEEEEGLELRK